MNKNKKIGTQGYCMGGPLEMVKTAAALLEIGISARVCSFHGGGLVTDKPDSPHLPGVQDARRECISGSHPMTITCGSRTRRTS